jgi:hypothetical protein
VLRFSEVKDVGATEAVECLKDVRFYRIVLDGAEYAQHLEKKDQAAIDLYRSIVSKSRVRCSVRFNGGQPAVPLEVDLSYQLLAHDDGCDD